MERNLRSIAILDIVLRVAMVFLAIGTVIVVGSAPSTLGNGGVGVDARVESFDVKAIGAEVPFSGADLVVNAKVPKNDGDTRGVIVGTQIVMAALLWAGVVTLWRIVRSTRLGEPFATANVGRLRLLSALLVAAPLVAFVANRLIEATFDEPGLRPELSQAGLVPMIGVALGVYVLAEVFERGVELRELEASTI